MFLEYDCTRTAAIQAAESLEPKQLQTDSIMQAVISMMQMLTGGMSNTRGLKGLQIMPQQPKRMATMPLEDSPGSMAFGFPAALGDGSCESDSQVVTPPPVPKARATSPQCDLQLALAPVPVVRQPAVALAPVTAVGGNGVDVNEFLDIFHERRRKRSKAKKGGRCSAESASSVVPAAEGGHVAVLALASAPAAAAKPEDGNKLTEGRDATRPKRPKAAVDGKAATTTAPPTEVEPSSSKKAKKAKVVAAPAAAGLDPVVPVDAAAGLLLGCSKCRGCHVGCSQCRNPSFKGPRWQR